MGREDAAQLLAEPKRHRTIAVIWEDTGDKQAKEGSYGQ